MPKSKPDDGQVFISEPKFTNTLEIHVGLRARARPLFKLYPDAVRKADRAA